MFSQKITMLTWWLHYSHGKYWQIMPCYLHSVHIHTYDLNLSTRHIVIPAMSVMSHIQASWFIFFSHDIVYSPGTWQWYYLFISVFFIKFWLKFITCFFWSPTWDELNSFFIPSICENFKRKFIRFKTSQRDHHELSSRTMHFFHRF